MTNPISSFNSQVFYANPEHEAIISILGRAGIYLTPADIGAISLGDQNIEDLTPLLRSLLKSEVLTLEIFKEVINSPCWCVIQANIDLLREARQQESKILNEENVKKMICHPNPFDLSQVLSFLQQRKKLYQRNFERAVNHPSSVVQVFTYLEQMNFPGDRVRSHPDFPHLAQALSCLQGMQWCNKEDIQNIITLRVQGSVYRIKEIADIFLCLKKINALDLDTFRLVMALDLERLIRLHQVFLFLQDRPQFNIHNAKVILEKPKLCWDMSNVVLILKEEIKEIIDSIINHSFHVIMNHSDSPSFVCALVCLARAGILNEHNRDVIVRRKYIGRLSVVFSSLQKDTVRILNQENFNYIVNSQALSQLDTIFYHLKQARILTQENFSTIMGQSNLSDLAAVLIRLGEKEGLTQNRFESYVLFHHLIGNQFNQVLPNVFPLELFDTTIQRCWWGFTAEQISTHITQYINVYVTQVPAIPLEQSHFEL